MNEEKKEHELIVKSDDLMSNLQSVDDVEKTVLRAEKYMIGFEKIIKMSYNMTNRSDWIDQNGTPYLQYKGATKIATLLGIKVYDLTCTSVTVTNTEKPYIEYTYEGNGLFNKREAHEIGTANTLDPLFSRGGRLPLSEVNLSNVKKKAHTNLLNRLVKNLVGLYHTWEEIEEITNGKICMNSVSSVKYAEKGKKVNNNSKDIKKMRTEIHSMILEACEGSGNKARAYLKQKTEWINKEGKKFEGKTKVDQLSENQIKFLYPKVKKDYEQYKKDRGM